MKADAGCSQAAESGNLQRNVAGGPESGSEGGEHQKARNDPAKPVSVTLSPKTSRYLRNQLKERFVLNSSREATVRAVVRMMQQM